MLSRLWLILLCSTASCLSWGKDRERQSVLLRDLSTTALLTTENTFSDAQGNYQLIFTEYRNRTCRPEHFQKLRKLGSGARGQVWRARHDSGMFVALKVMHDKGPIAYKRIRAEEVFLARLDHVSIPKLYCSFQENGQTVLAMTLAEARDLFDWIYEQRLLPRLTRRVMVQLVNVLGYLHANNVMHRDVKPENMMVTEAGHLYLVDYDHAFMTEAMLSTPCGTLMNMAPELLRREPYNNGIDWYAAGLVLYEMVMGVHPYDRIRDRDGMLERAARGCPRTGDRLVDDLVGKLSHVQMRLRWSVANGNWKDIITHPYFLDGERTRHLRINKVRERRAQTVELENLQSHRTEFDTQASTRAKDAALSANIPSNGTEGSLAMKARMVRLQLSELKKTKAEILRERTTVDLLSKTETFKTSGIYQPIYTHWNGRICHKGRFSNWRQIGNGATGTVYYALAEDNVTVAIKLVENDELQAIRAEDVLLSRLNHPGIINLHCVFPYHDNVALVMPFIKGVNLLAKLSQGIDSGLRKSIMRQLVDVLRYLHSQEVWHRDIKLENLMLSEDNKLYLIDFGLATINGLDSSFVGTETYMAPEVWKSNTHSAASDWYAVGILFYELLMGSPPFQWVENAFDPSRELKKACTKGIIPLTGHNDEDELIQGLTLLDVEQRWGDATLETIRDHRAIN
ncbi:hypothetical protein PSACC_03408 [Paramicrosporidium saccamoebae]|uniref:Protein kinase domain-containing protein n=1 Tax=Paramicrosporidium saccamoebae TaxID=1246581 RepID=A0A2H9TG69_9FUNG|nr:hypothetical protein PSACC_03408 [Paramicrosporidium saccamoebae]